MPRQVDMRREHMIRERLFREREQSFETYVHWLVFDHGTSERDTIYDESGEKRYRKRANVPILWWYDDEGGDRLTGEGRTLLRVMNIAVTVAALRNAGIDPESDDRVNDLVLFRGWYWEVTEFTLTSQSTVASPTSEAGGDDATVNVRLYRRFPMSDMPLDEFPGEGVPEEVVTEPDPEAEPEPEPAPTDIDDAADWPYPVYNP
jgi:hypothetical protein